ncbi:hypothetical protein H3Z85_04750 [Chryseobacterium indologenes]|uniref:Uncharacterized protein n=1 Tax=Chryseobacterium indologenes TaxID=253 RepID=A0A1Z3W520_CHRID|nr:MULTISPECIES: hypothetical protein [Chryseobacterium]ASE62811.1 hypothetical protein CEQ15_15540 [Chryseobacterium indologenes]ATN06634.1 hypothetical protein CRN76_15075 [Chryseobacterium indologenes]AYY84605.1 hypothetical protein EGX91_08650 [Chryseobacterium indologenes]AYZ34290.1 hypothetical protein EGY07_01310 [Chryseobacterium indologenes]AZB18510.1 hypothetical protein EG352_12305 [Chryseobacterium indologenes]
MTKIISIVLLLATVWAKAQVGINTTKPEKELTVNGTMKTSGIVLKTPMEKLGANENYTFIIKSPAPENKITAYNDSFVPNSPAPINLIQFKITCDPSDKDWVNQFDTKINSNKFLVVISSFGFTQSTRTYSADWVTPVPQIFAYPTAGTWKLKADYQGFSPDASLPTGVWTLNLLVFDRSYAKDFNSTQDLKASTTGAATAPLIQ